MEKPISETEVEIRNEYGLHMRPAMLFVDIASQYESDVSVSNGEMSVDGKSIMEMSMLAATVGTKLQIRAEGSDSEQAVEALRELVEVKLFEEEASSEGKK